jgi:hypothetical protein
MIIDIRMAHLINMHVDLGESLVTSAEVPVQS